MTMSGWKPIVWVVEAYEWLKAISLTHPSIRPSVSLNLIHRFLSNFGCCFPWAIRSNFFWIFGISFCDFLRIFLVFVNMGPYRSPDFKTLLLQIAAESFQTYSEFSSQLSSQNYVWDFWNFENWNFNELLLTLKCLRSIWGHSVHFRFSKTCIAKMAGRRAKRRKFGPRGWVFSVHRVLLTLQWLRSFWGHSVHSGFWQVCISKMLVVERNGLKFGLRVLLALKWLRSFWGHLEEWKVYLNLCVIQFMWSLSSILSNRAPSPLGFLF